MIDPHIDNERFKDLVKKAIGDNSQAAFSKKAGIGKFTLNRFVNQGTTAVPNTTTLRAIVQASEGRITLQELCASVGKFDVPDEPGKPADPFSEEDYKEYVKKSLELAQAVSKTIHTCPIKVNTMQDWIEMFHRIYDYRFQSCTMSAETENAVIYDKQKQCGDRGGSEYAVPLKAIWYDLDNGRIYTVTAVLFYCKTVGTEYSQSGIIMRDSAFDFKTVFDMGMADWEMVSSVMQKDNAIMTDYPVCLTIKETDTAMLR